jgi:lysophospholipase L1-like esterase
MVFVVLGDSTSAGVGAGAPDRAYPVQLARRLAAGGRRVRLVNLGISGARVRDVLDHQVPAAESASPDLVFVGIGGNDATHLTPIAAVRRDMAAVMARLQRTGAGIAVAGAPDMRAAAFLQPLRTLSGWRGRRVAEAIERAALRWGAEVVPLRAATREFVSSHPERYFSEDGFHPGPQGYAAWADAIAPVLESVLAARR